MGWTQWRPEFRRWGTNYDVIIRTTSTSKVSPLSSSPPHATLFYENPAHCKSIVLQNPHIDRKIDSSMASIVNRARLTQTLVPRLSSSSALPSASLPRPSLTQIFNSSIQAHKTASKQIARTYRTTTANMSFSNTSVDNADPYKSKNLEEPELKDKVEDLVAFIEKCKFCMMATRTKDGLIASRCMALAGKVGQLL